MCLLGELAALVWYPPAGSHLLGLLFAAVHVAMFGWVLAVDQIDVGCDKYPRRRAAFIFTVTMTVLHLAA